MKAEDKPYHESLWNMTVTKYIKKEPTAIVAILQQDQEILAEAYDSINDCTQG